MRPGSPSAPASRRGQASVEYLVVAVGVLIALATVAIAGRDHCVKNSAGDLTDAGCRDVTRTVGAALQGTVEEVTFLVNLPF